MVGMFTPLNCIAVRLKCSKDCLDCNKMQLVKHILPLDFLFTSQCERKIGFYSRQIEQAYIIRLSFFDSYHHFYTAFVIYGLIVITSHVPLLSSQSSTEVNCPLGQHCLALRTTLNFNNGMLLPFIRAASQYTL